MPERFLADDGQTGMYPLECIHLTYNDLTVEVNTTTESDVRLADFSLMWIGSRLLMTPK